MARYRALRPLAWRTDPDAIRRVLRGENPSFRRSAMTECAAGDIVETLPRQSVPVLLRKGWIEPVTAGGEVADAEA